MQRLLLSIFIGYMVFFPLTIFAQKAGETTLLQEVERLMRKVAEIEKERAVILANDEKIFKELPVLRTRIRRRSHG